MSDPSTVVTGANLSELVGTDTLHGLVVGSGIVLDGDLSSHTTHGVDTSLVAGLDEKLDVGIHEGNGHGDGRSVGEDEVGVVAELLDGAEDVVPSATVETGAVVAELVDDLVHLKGSEDGLDEDSSSDGSSGHANVVLSKVEGVVPETSLEVALHLGEVEVRSESLLLGLEGIVEEVETEIEERTGDGLAINSDVLLLEVPSTGTDDEGRELAVSSELVLLLALFEVDLATVHIVQADLTIDHVLPGWGAGILEIGHISPDVGVVGIDHHLSVGGAGDLNSAVDKTGGGGGASPSSILTDVLGLGEEIGEDATVDLGLADLSSLEQVLSGGIE